MHLALAPQHDLVRLGVVHDRDRGIFVEQLGERLAELDVVLALLGGDRDARAPAACGVDLGDRRMRLLAGGQRIAGLGVIELAERDGFAGCGRPALLGVLADAA